MQLAAALPVALQLPLQLPLQVPLHAPLVVVFVPPEAVQVPSHDPLHVPLHAAATSRLAVQLPVALCATRATQVAWIGFGGDIWCRAIRFHIAIGLAL